jgi:hypothetical protein
MVQLGSPFSSLVHFPSCSFSRSLPVVFFLSFTSRRVLSLVHFPSCSFRSFPVVFLSDSGIAFALAGNAGGLTASIIRTECTVAANIRRWASVGNCTYSSTNSRVENRSLGPSITMVNEGFRSGSRHSQCPSSLYVYIQIDGSKCVKFECSCIVTQCSPKAISFKTTQTLKAQYPPRRNILGRCHVVEALLCHLVRPFDTVERAVSPHERRPRGVLSVALW